MLDFVAVAMLAVLVALTISICLARARKFRIHRVIQLVTAGVLLFALLAFEIDIRFFSPWRELAKPSPFYESGWVDWTLVIHLVFAIPTPVAWIIVIVMAHRKFRTGFDQDRFNRIHRISGRFAAGLMVMTAITGWVFYYIAFVA